MITETIISKGVQLYDLTCGNTGKVDNLLRLFHDTFPQYAQIAPRLAQKAALPANANPHFIAHQWLLEIDQVSAGLCSFKYSPVRNLGLVVFISVAECFRHEKLEGKRISEYLIQHCIEQIRQDAHSMGRPDPDGLVLEVEPPRLVERYRQFGFITLPVDYREPIFRQARQGNHGPDDLSQVKFEPRFLGAFPIDVSPAALYKHAFVERVIAMLACDHYQISPELLISNVSSQ